MDARHELLTAVQGFAKPMALNAICKLGIPDILNRAGSNAFMCVEEIAERLPSDRVDAGSLGRILDGCVTFGLLAAKQDGSNGALKRYYGLNALSSLLVRDGNPGCLAPMVTLQMHPTAQAPWLHLADAVLTGTYPFTIAHGMVLKTPLTTLSLHNFDHDLHERS
jgi:hypothetical protein